MLKILVVSDLHAFTPPNHNTGKTIDDPPSFLVNTEVESKKQPNPIELIPDLLKAEGLDVDWILCPGDIADRADPDAQAFAWRHLVNLKKSTKARLLLGTVGNHDVDSRLQFSEFDPKGHLQALSPPFPGINGAAANRYWARNFHIQQEGTVRLLNLNSAAYHGFSSRYQQTKPEYLQGRVSERTIEAIRKELSTAKSFDHNILFTHHHPFQERRNIRLRLQQHGARRKTCFNAVRAHIGQLAYYSWTSTLPCTPICSGSRIPVSNFLRW